jgi:ribonuclease HI
MLKDNKMSGQNFTDETINIYIDGSCIGNGSPNAKAGYGVYFKPDDERNEYARVVGKQTNNTGELMAFIRAVEKMEGELVKAPEKPVNKINIYTDSEYVLKCAGAYGDKLSKNDWKTSTGKTPPNLVLIQRIQEIYKPYKKHFNLQHIKAHTGLNDEHSIGNAEADRLANLAVGVTVSCNVLEKLDIDRQDGLDGLDRLDRTLISNIRETPIYTKHYINIKYEHKDAIKKLGAKWDLRCSKWYYEDNIADSNKKAIQDIEKMSENDVVNEEKITTEAGVDIELHKKIYVKIPFINKDAVKKLGCRWEPEKKSWYYMSNFEKNKIDKIKKLESV